MKRILVTGAYGQIGTELIVALRKKYGLENVIATDVKNTPPPEIADGPFDIVDVTKRDSIEKALKKYEIDSIFHLAAILSATGEQKHLLAWDVNMNGTINILEAARENSIRRVIIPSSIAAFGPETPKENTPQETVMRPRTMYGITKVAGELLGEYYVRKFGLDVRGVRFPGIISWVTPPGGGTTDYAVAIYYAAVLDGYYECFVREDTVLPMMYMPDAIKALMDLAEVPFGRLTHHCDFNVTAISCRASDFEKAIKEYYPDFKVVYKPDRRQYIADSWPNSIDDSAARLEWQWCPEYDLKKMTEDMIMNLRKKFGK
ncbi:MAG: NAD-dependent epimerase/dehydratase family protein [Thermoplasmata archaeon]